ncbi:MAG: SDR family NAD(P)-dependent oxidoreductase [Endomicrobium sp.]|nr:SDR family NAD(P)-dependent oxidoreductase [Endomicrobium sp.]
MITNRKYVITGATSGIGNALAVRFSKNNVVFAGYRNKDFVENLKKISSNIIPFYIDMEEKGSISRAAEYIKSQADKIDVLVNAAGYVVGGAMESVDVDDIRKQFEVNVFSHLDFSQQLLPVLKDKIINISSMASFGIFPFIAPYCASKRSLDILFNLMQIEMSAKSALKIVSVKPGVIATALWGKSMELNKKSIEKAKDGYAEAIEYLRESAYKNQTNGLNVEKVVDLIVKIDSCRRPKSSYTIGADAKVAAIFSMLPQRLVNFMVKKLLHQKIKR